MQQLVPKPQTAPAAAERQIKYLGLVIEKNDEQDLHVDDMQMYYKYRSLREEMHAFKAGKRNLEEGLFIQRQYFPVRERYIRIVKKCRRRVIESFEKRGGRDFRRTRNALLAVVDQQHR